MRERAREYGWVLHEGAEHLDRLVALRAAARRAGATSLQEAEAAGDALWEAWRRRRRAGKGREAAAAAQPPRKAAQRGCQPLGRDARRLLGRLPRRRERG